MAANKPIWTGNTGLTRTSEAGGLVVGERTMLKDVYEGTYANCWAGLLARGTYGTGSRAGWVVTNCQIDPLRGAKGKLTISWEPGGYWASMPLPCDDFDIEIMELYPRIERNKLFNDKSCGGSAPDITTAMLSLVYSAIHAHTPEARQTQEQRVYNYPDRWQSDMGIVLLDKLRKGEETFYLAGMKYTWWFFTYTVPALSRGGVIEFPFGPGAVPNCLPQDYSWLRLCDVMKPVGVNGSMFKTVRTWMGGPAGHWDSDIYT